jgi:hypothetical protein
MAVLLQALRRPRKTDEERAALRAQEEQQRKNGAAVVPQPRQHDTPTPARPKPREGSE